MIVTMAHGSGGESTSELISSIFSKYFKSPHLCRFEDAAVLSIRHERIAMTTDSFVVEPLFFKGGDIGKLAVCGTVNDLLMMGAQPQYITAGFILHEGLSFEILEAVAASMAAAALEAGVELVAADTKVVEGQGGMYINTSGIGAVADGRNITPSQIRPGDAVIVSGSLGNHHSAILSARMNIENAIESDCAPLNDITGSLLNNGIEVHAMRDITRGGLGTVLNELAVSAGVSIEINETAIPVDPDVKGFCDILGLDPLYMANEGKLAAIVAAKDAEAAINLLHSQKNGRNARIIGTACEKGKHPATVLTRLGSRRVLDVLRGEGLPRIC